MKFYSNKEPKEILTIKGKLGNMKVKTAKRLEIP
jgi:hypothetical protein